MTIQTLQVTGSAAPHGPGKDDLAKVQTQFSGRCDLGEKSAMTTIFSAAASSADRLNPGPQGLPVLVVEDERTIAEEIRIELEAEGYSVKLVDTAEEGFKAARSGWASVLVVDRMLNGSDGLSIVETLRREGDSTPVLVISALSSVDERISGLKA